MTIFPYGKLKFLQFWHSIKTNNCINNNSNRQLARANGDILDNRAFDYDVNDDTKYHSIWSTFFIKEVV